MLRDRAPVKTHACWHKPLFKPRAGDDEDGCVVIAQRDPNEATPKTAHEDRERDERDWAEQPPERRSPSEPASVRLCEPLSSETPSVTSRDRGTGSASVAHCKNRLSEDRGRLDPHQQADYAGIGRGPLGAVRPSTIAMVRSAGPTRNEPRRDASEIKK
jgi:hypothetical protein